MDTRLSFEESNVLKAFSILFVILDHATLHGTLTGIGIRSTGIVMYALCEGGMSSFLFLSGYGIYKSYKKKGLNNYFEKKVDKILIPYMGVEMILYIALVIRTHVIQANFHIANFMGVSAKNSYDGTMWYISYIFFWYTLFYIFFRTVGNFRYGSLIAATLLFLISIVAIFVFPAIWGGSFYCIIQFSVGIFYGMFSDKIERISRLWCIFIGLISIIAFLCFNIVFRPQIVSDVTKNIGSLGFTFFAIILFKYLKLDRLKWIVWIGEISFYIYLLEWVVIVNNSKNVWMLLIFMGIGIILAAVYDKIIKFILGDKKSLGGKCEDK